MKKIKIIVHTYYNQLENEINRLLKDGWEFKTAYSDGKSHFAVLEKAE